MGCVEVAPRSGRGVEAALLYLERPAGGRMHVVAAPATCATFRGDGSQCWGRHLQDGVCYGLPPGDRGPTPSRVPSRWERSWAV